MILRILALAALLLAASSAAHARVDAPSLTCQALRSILERQGSAVVHSSPFIYDRYVKDATSCSPGDDLRNAFVPSSDSRRCWIGYTCKTWSNQRM